jgi:hypothetical protein
MHSAIRTNEFAKPHEQLIRTSSQSFRSPPQILERRLRASNEVAKGRHPISLEKAPKNLQDID